MQRSLVSLLLLFPIVFASCDRQTTAEFVLSVGLNADHLNSHRGLLTDKPQATLQDVAEILRGMHELQPIRKDDEPALRRLMTQLDRVSDDLKSSLPQANQQRLLREARFAAATWASKAAPERYQASLEAARAGLGQDSEDPASLSRQSTQRLISEFMEGSTTTADSLEALTMHVATYPECRMNSQLFLTAVQRLANEDKPDDAIRTAKQGLRFCSGSPLARQLQRNLEELYEENPGRIGVPMKISGRSLSGGRFDLRATRGVPVLVVFWATWCPACIQEVPYLQGLQETYRQYGLRIVGVSLDDNQSALESFMDSNGLNWPVVVSLRPGEVGWDNPFAGQYGIDSIPNSFLLNAEGEVVAAGLQTPEAIESALRQLIRDANGV